MALTIKECFGVRQQFANQNSYWWHIIVWVVSFNVQKFANNLYFYVVCLEVITEKLLLPMSHSNVLHINIINFIKIDPFTMSTRD